MNGYLEQKLDYKTSLILKNGTCISKIIYPEGYNPDLKPAVYGYLPGSGGLTIKTDGTLAEKNDVKNINMTIENSDAIQVIMTNGNCGDDFINSLETAGIESDKINIQGFSLGGNNASDVYKSVLDNYKNKGVELSGSNLIVIDPTPCGLENSGYDNIIKNAEDFKNSDTLVITYSPQLNPKSPSVVAEKGGIEVLEISPKSGHGHIDFPGDYFGDNIQGVLEGKNGLSDEYKYYLHHSDGKTVDELTPEQVAQYLAERGRGGIPEYVFNLPDDLLREFLTNRVNTVNVKVSTSVVSGWNNKISTYTEELNNILDKINNNISNNLNSDWKSDFSNGYSESLNELIREIKKNTNVFNEIVNFIKNYIDTVPKI